MFLVSTTVTLLAGALVVLEMFGVAVLIGAPVDLVVFGAEGLELSSVFVLGPLLGLLLACGLCSRLNKPLLEKGLKRQSRYTVRLCGVQQEHT